MARKSQDLDKKLILIGQSLIQEIGVSNLSMREVAKVADVNLGMLSYYFKGKDDFILSCLNELYAPFVKELEEIEIESFSEENFELFLSKLAYFSRDNRQLIIILIKESISQDENVKKFIKDNFSKHFDLIKNALRSFLKIKSTEKEREQLAFQYLIALIGFPSLLSGFIEIVKSKQKSETDEQLNQRVKKALRILKEI